MALITDHKISLNTLEVTSEPQSYELPKGPTSKKDLSYFQTKLENGVVALDLIVANMNCAGCMSKIERTFSEDPKLQKVRVNLSQKLVHFEWFEGETGANELFDDLTALGFKASPLLNDNDLVKAESVEMRRLLWCLGVAGFAAANVMLLSVSVWSGATGATRDLFHWLSALIAIPAIAFAGRPFFSSAWTALRAGHLNMDVPISLAVILATGLSLFETAGHGEHAFFDAALTLLFFLLIGRTLDRLMREQAFSGVRQLLAFKSTIAQIIDDNGKQRTLPISDIEIGMRVLVLPGETIPVDGEILIGKSDIDWSLVNGEAVPRKAQAGDEVFSGLVNLSGPLEIKTTAVGETTLLSEIIRLMEQANERAPRYRKLADRAASVYAPLVHLIALFTFAGWMLYGMAWQDSLYTAISVLIITCPCALGLAVPVVQVVAGSIAHKHGLLMKDGAALEKLSEVDTVIFDKTGTLTLSKLKLSGQYFQADHLLPMASQLAKNSLHPLSKALANTYKNSDFKENEKPSNVLIDIEEHPGLGLRATYQGGELRLGSFEWCKIDKTYETYDQVDLMLWASFSQPGEKPIVALFTFEDELRPGVMGLIRTLKAQNLDVQLLSGDRQEAVERMAQLLNIDHFKAEMKPDEKCSYIEELGQNGSKVLMVGDGINDGPSLKAAFTSLSPSSASDVAQVTANFVLMNDSLKSIIGLFQLAKSSRALIYQNFALAIVYNLIAVPIAVFGFATPIVAAIAMSLSSMIVTLNALRLHLLASSYQWQEDKSFPEV
ncbi:MAG: heavy metal translocating P-type ATPase [Hyphomicrobiales bacterium]